MDSYHQGIRFLKVSFGLNIFHQSQKEDVTSIVFQSVEGTNLEEKINIPEIRNSIAK